MHTETGVFEPRRSYTVRYCEQIEDRMSHFSLVSFKKSSKTKSKEHDTVLLIGGYNDDDECGLKDVLLYSIEDDAWSTSEQKMNFIRQSAGSCVVKDRIYVVGGYDGHLELNSIEYMPVADVHNAEVSWRLILLSEQDFMARSNPVVCPISNNIIVILGGSYKHSSDFFKSIYTAHTFNCNTH